MRAHGLGIVLVSMALVGPAVGQQPQKPQEKKPAKPPQLPPGTRVERDLAYGPLGERNTLDLYLPEKADGPLPLVIWVHGGAWRGGSKANGGPAIRLLQHGYAVASINYRLSQHALFPAQLNDCKAAVRYLRANAKKFGLDAEHFGCWGPSAGGHLVALLGTAGGAAELEGDGPIQGVSSRVQAVCDWYGPSDFAKVVEQAIPGTKIDRTSPNCPEALLIGGKIADNPDKVKRANPITYIGKDCPPFLIMHGEQDDVVPVGQSRILHEALKAAGCDSTFVSIPDARHGQGVGTAEHFKQIVAFFDRHLKKK
jgi:acetyl esterase/lipase